MVNNEVLQMTQRDIDKLKVLHSAIHKQITQAKAGETLNLSREWVNCLCQKIKKEGDKAIIHGGRLSEHGGKYQLIRKNPLN